MAKNWGGGARNSLKIPVEHVSGCTYHFLMEWDINVLRVLTFKSPKYNFWWTSVKQKSSRRPLRGRFAEGKTLGTSVSLKSTGKIFGALRPIVSEIFDVEVLRAKTLRHYTQNRLCQLKRYLSYSRLWWMIALGAVFQNSRSPPWPLWMHENSCVFGVIGWCFNRHVDEDDTLFTLVYFSSCISVTYVYLVKMFEYNSFWKKYFNYNVL